MRFKEWSAFVDAAMDLQGTHGHEIRAGTRFCPARGLLVVRLANDQKTLLFASRQAVYLNRFDALLRTLARKMHNLPIALANNPQQNSQAASSALKDVKGQADKGEKKKKTKKKR